LPDFYIGAHAAIEAMPLLTRDAADATCARRSPSLREASAEEFPLASAALERLLAEPIPKDSAKDDLWVSLVVGLAQEQLAYAFADETLD
jgi:hypothetical protein